MTRHLGGYALVVAAGAGAAGPAAAQIVPGSIALEIEDIAGGMAAPIYVTHAGDGTGRLFVCDQVGKIWVIENGVRLPTPFLDLSGEVVAVNPGFDERGLLGLAFHPLYANNGRFFVRYSKAQPNAMGRPCVGTTRGCHEEILAEFTVSPNPNVANPTGTILFRVDEPEFNHNGGQVMFGPDGFLYLSLGDGGGAHDGLACTPNPCHGPGGNGQNVNTPLGKVLRVDVDAPGVPYSIPPGNPFAGGGGAPEIFAWGFRNPYRFSFDDGPGGSGKLYVGDVGQALYEEVDDVVVGGNYGWVIREGAHCFDPLNPGTPLPTCNTTGLIDPISEYTHADGLAVVGGFVYRGDRFPALRGMYLFGDWSLSFGSASGQLYYFNPAAPAQVLEFQLGAINRPLGLFLVGIGRGEDGELYLGVTPNNGPRGTDGRVVRVVMACRADCDASTGPAVLDIFDFLCFQNEFAAGSGYACDFDTSTGPGVCDIFDFLGFQNEFASGCP